MPINDLIAETGEDTRFELTNAPVEVEDRDTFPSEDEIFSVKRRWLRIENVVVLVGDLVNSTKLSLGRHLKSTARIYEASTGGAIRIVNDDRFEPDFIDIQGDGFFALFHGDLAFQRAICAGITLKTWSERHLVPEIKARMGERCPETGFKVGMAAGTLVVKNVGKPRKSQEPVWAGKPVNWAYKCAQAATRHQLVVTEKVWQRVYDNDYLRFSCGGSETHGEGSPVDLWSGTIVDALGEAGHDCHLLGSGWCPMCGDDFCDAVLAGKTRRSEVEAYRRVA